MNWGNPLRGPLPPARLPRAARATTRTVIGGRAGVPASRAHRSLAACPPSTPRAPPPASLPRFAASRLGRKQIVFFVFFSFVTGWHGTLLKLVVAPALAGLKAWGRQWAATWQQAPRARDTGPATCQALPSAPLPTASAPVPPRHLHHPQDECGPR